MSTNSQLDDRELGLLPDGRPDPSYAAALGLVPAPRGRRALAFIIDAALVGVVTLPLSLGAYPPLLDAALRISDGADPVGLVSSGALTWALIWYAVGHGLLIILLLVQLILHGRRGVTIGKAITGIRSVNVRSFARPGFWRVVLRALVLWAATGIVPLLGALPFLLSPLWDRDGRGRGWLDVIGATWFIDVRKGLDPYDAKALRLARKRLGTTPVVIDAPLPSLSTGSAGAVASYLPSSRSSSGVVSSAGAGEAAPWTPPPLGDSPPVASTAQESPAAPVPAAAVPPPPIVTPPAPTPHPFAATGTELEPLGPVLPSRTAAVLVFDDGSRVEITKDRVVGRNPREVAEREGLEPLTLSDPLMQISKAHATLGVDRDGVWVLDRGSSNGTTVITPANIPEHVDPGSRHPVPWGATVELGGRRFRVEPQAVGSEPA